jgi:hypothetical protein
MARKAKWEDLDNPGRRKQFLKAAIEALHQRRDLILNNPVLQSTGQTPDIGIRGLVIMTGSRTKWEEEDVLLKMSWVWELEKLGLITLTPNKRLPDTQPKHYYQASLTDYSMKEAFDIIDNF